MNFIKQKDFLFPVILCLVVSVLIGLNYYTFGNFLYDCGREFLVPDAINKGNVPIKDIFLTYLPLSYQINAIVFKIFGASLDVLRIMGVLASFVFVVFAYLCARQFKDEAKSFTIALVTSFMVMFNVSYLHNYVLGYSYAFIWGAAVLFVSLYFAILFIKDNKFLYPAYFALGVCIALKLEFAFLLVPYFILLIYKKVPLKKIIVAHIALSSPLLLSFFALFISGFGFGDLKNYFDFISKFMQSEILKYYNSQVFVHGLIPWLRYNIVNAFQLILAFMVCSTILFFPYRGNRKIIDIFALAACFIFLFVLALIKGNLSVASLFSFLCVTSLYILYKSIKNKDIPLAFLCLVQLFLAARFNFIYSSGYIAYTMPVAFVVNLVYFYSDKKKSMFVSFMVLLALLNVFYFTLSQRLFALNEVKTERGRMLVDNKDMADAINMVLLYMGKTDKDKSFLVLPDGAMFNFMANRKTNLKYYQLLPNHIEVLGEENIVDGLKENPIDYIITTNTDYSIYGTPLFCKDFGQKICSFVNENYTMEKAFSKGKYEFLVFRLK